MTPAAGMPPSEAEAGGGSPVGTVFFGSGRFAIPILDAALSLPGLAVVGVVSVPDRPSGRGRRVASPPLVDHARDLGLPILQPASLREPAMIEAITALSLDLALLADYGRLVPATVLAIPRRGFLNVHPSLLPRHRGATPIQATILDGDRRAGVSLFEMDAGLDTGPIVASGDWPLRGDETAPELEAEAARRGGELLRDVLPAWLVGERGATPQPASGVTLTRPLRREDGRLDPLRPAAELARRVRALQPWPGTYLDTPAGRLAVVSAQSVPSAVGQPAAEGAAAGADSEVGRLVALGDGLALATAEGWLRLDQVRPAGGRTMSGAEVRRGRPRLVGTAAS